MIEPVLFFLSGFSFWMGTRYQRHLSLDTALASSRQAVQIVFQAIAISEGTGACDRVISCLKKQQKSSATS